MKLYCSICGREQDSRKGTSHTHTVKTENGEYPVLVPLSVIVERKNKHGEEKRWKHVRGTRKTY